jgi:hypothetical protein
MEKSDMGITFTVARLVFAACILAVAPSAMAQPSLPTDLEVPPVPTGLGVPDDQELFLAGYAIGTQNYMCLPASGKAAWRAVGPQATLFGVDGDGFVEQVTTHFLSTSPDGTARPTWQHSDDTSRVWGRVVASSTDPEYVAPGAIPWLLLESAGTAKGPTDGSQLAQTTYIQRLNTSGGLAPSIGCRRAADVGASAMVPYTTEYYFYRKRVE